jgi:hypothetical protein
MLKRAHDRCWCSLPGKTRRHGEIIGGIIPEDNNFAGPHKVVVFFCSLSGNSGSGRIGNSIFVRRGGEVFYVTGTRECDFICKDQKNLAIRVCYEFTPKNRDRETVGLLEDMAKFDFASGMILTYDQEAELHADGKTIVLQPVWKWQLDESVL